MRLAYRVLPGCDGKGTVVVDPQHLTIDQSTGKRPPKCAPPKGEPDPTLDSCLAGYEDGLIDARNGVQQ